jgi:hypothetical protein
MTALAQEAALLTGKLKQTKIKIPDFVDFLENMHFQLSAQLATKCAVALLRIV